MINGSIFLLIPNNSGSTFIYKSISNCEKVAHLKREGQFVSGYSGTRPFDYNCQFIWAGTDFQHIIADEKKHDWDKTKKAWMKNIINNQNDSIFVEKSPPHIGKMDMLKSNFINPKFVISVRNPYAVFESIQRARKMNQVSNQIIANHIVNTMKIQRENIKKLSPTEFVFFTYEELCDNTDTVTSKLKQLTPNFHDLSFNNKIPVKRRYNTSVNNYNTDQIANLDAKSINDLNEVLKWNTEMLDYYGYEII